MAIGLGIAMPKIWCGSETGKATIVLYGDLTLWFKAQGLSAYIRATNATGYVARDCVMEHFTHP